uniref:Aminoglycoside phosphotransferase domain-containing protein n=1 Tax=Bionectria ochroleuca TaxID=29856 RepID=A0A0B7JYV9_BIOOC
MPPPFLRRACRFSFTHEIHTIYVSGDESRLRKLNASRRTAGEKIISALIDSIDGDALRERAETLRHGTKCTVTLPAANQAYLNTDIVGGRNYHGSIVFEDGQAWLARFRLPNHNAPPVEERNFDRRSEFATYRFLAEAAVPVPRVYDYADDEDPSNAVGAGYILVEKLAGKPLAWHEADQAQREKFMRQLADIYTQLEKHPLGALGRLQPSSSSPGQPEVGPAFFDYDSSGRAVPFGPFDNTDDYYKALIQHRTGLIKTGEIAPSAPVDQYLVYRSLLDRLPRSEQGPFFLRHVDSRDENFLVDPDYNITGIIDWELAIVTAKGAAFQSPLLLYNLGELYHQGLSTPSKDEKRLAKILQEETKSDELSALVAQKLHFRVDQVIETNPENGKNFTRVFSGWWKAAAGEQTFDWDTWYRNALDKYGDGGLTPSTVR